MSDPWSLHLINKDVRNGVGGGGGAWGWSEGAKRKKGTWLRVWFVLGLVPDTLPVLLVKENRISCQKCCFAFQLIWFYLGKRDRNVFTDSIVRCWWLGQESGPCHSLTNICWVPTSAGYSLDVGDRGTIRHSNNLQDVCSLVGPTDEHTSKFNTGQWADGMSI